MKPTVFLLLFSLSLNAQTTYQELGKRFVSIVQTGNISEISKIQAIPEIYRIIASGQMKNKSDDEIMAIVNNPTNSLSSQTEELFKTLVDYSIKTTDLTFKSANVANFPNLSPQFFSMKMFLSYQGILDTLVFDVFELKGRWYLVEISASDNELGNILDKKGVPGPMYYKKKAAIAQKDKNYTSAIKALSLALEKSKETELYYLRGYNYSLLKDYAAAKNDLSKAIAQDPQFVKAYLELGYVHAQQFEYPEAIQNLKKTIQLDSTLYFGHYYLADAYDKTGDTTQAAKHYLHADKVSQQSFYNPILALALMRSRNGNHAGAEPMYELAAKRSPNTFEIHYYKGFGYIAMGLYGKAIEAYDTALSIYPNSADALYERAYAKMSLQNHTDALVDFEKAISVNPNFSSPRLHIHIGNCLLSLGQKSKACESFKKALTTAKEEAEMLLDENCK